MKPIGIKILSFRIFNRSIFVPVGVGVLLCTALFCGRSAYGVQQDEVDTIIRVEGAVQGSGVLVDKQGLTYTVLTAWHVLKSNKRGEEISLVTHDGRKHLSSITKANQIGDTDMATVSFSSNLPYRIAKYDFRDSVKNGDVVSVFGYPNDSSSTLRVEVGSMLANADVGIDQGYQLLYTTDTSPGMSGGAIFDIDKKLVGIHGRGELDQGKSQRSGRIVKTNINQGVPLYFYRQYMEGGRIQAKSVDASTWDDYLALFQSIDNVREQSGTRLNIQQTLERLANMLIELKPNNSLSWGIRASLEHQRDPLADLADNSFLQKAMLLAERYIELADSAWGAYRSGNFAQALALAQESTEYVSEHGPATYLLLSGIRLVNHDYEAALVDARKGVALASALFKSGTSLWLQDLPVEQSKKADYALAGALQNNLGASFYELGKYNEAASAYVEAISIHLGVSQGLRNQEILREAFKGMALVNIRVSGIDGTREASIKACDYYFDAKSYGGETIELLEDRCLQYLPRYASKEMSSLMNASANAICMSHQYAVDFFDVMTDVESIVKDEIFFKSQSSLHAWLMTVAWRAYKICPKKRVGIPPDEDWNWDGYWDHHYPRLPN